MGDPRYSELTSGWYATIHTGKVSHVFDYVENGEVLLRYNNGMPPGDLFNGKIYEFPELPLAEDMKDILPLAREDKINRKSKTYDYNHLTRDFISNPLPLNLNFTKLLPYIPGLRTQKIISEDEYRLILKPLVVPDRDRIRKQRFVISTE